MSEATQSVFAAIDVGSHTIRLLIAEADGANELIPVRTERRITRLATDFQDGESLKADPVRKSIAVIKEFAGLTKEHGVSAVACGATGVVRRAVNGGEFLRKVAETTGVRGRIVSEETEAFLSAKGVLSVLPAVEGKVVTFDLGGSSTEFLLLDTSRTDPIWSTSVFIGAATATARFLQCSPCDDISLLEAIRDLREILSPALSELTRLLGATNGAVAPHHLVGTAGTVTTLAAMFHRMTRYEPFKINGTLLTREWLAGTVQTLAGLAPAARRGIPGLEQGREDIILGGALIVREILCALEAESLTVTDGGFLEGLLLDLLEKQYGWPRTLRTRLTWRAPTG